MDKSIIWFTTLTGGQVGVHIDNLRVYMSSTSFFSIKVVSTGQMFNLYVDDNIDALDQYDEQYVEPTV